MDQVEKAGRPSITEYARPAPGTTVLRIDDYRLMRNIAGRIWIEQAGGEGMDLAPETERELGKLLDGFFREFF